MSLESLKNPVSRLAVLPDAMNVNKDPNDNSPYWNPASQYYTNDVVLSSVNSGAYLMVGGPTDNSDPLTGVKGGDDPSADTTGVWEKLSQSSWAGYFNPTITTPGAGATTIAVSANNVYSALPGYSYMVTFSGTVTFPLVAAATEWSTWTWTPSGTGALSLVMDVQPTVGNLATNFSLSGVLTMGAAVVLPALDIITLTGAKASAGQVPTFTNVRMSYTRID